jgi:hypothetical protein
VVLVTHAAEHAGRRIHISNWVKRPTDLERDLRTRKEGGKILQTAQTDRTDADGHIHVTRTFNWVVRPYANII